MDRPRVIVTRPLAQALPWVEALRAAGLDAEALPLIDIEPLADAAPLRAAWQGLGGCALAMFVSPNAVAHFFAARPAAAAWPPATLAGSTGPGTTAALSESGVPPACIVEPLPGAPFDTESLWARLQTRDWQGRRVLVVRGEDGRDWLAGQLRAAGATVEPLAAYRRAAPRPDAAARALLAAAVAAPERHCWVFSSSEAIGHLRALAPGADWSGGHALASHPRIAQTAREAGFGDVQLVDPRPQAVAAAVTNHATHPSLP